jgi:deoxyribodipyrimidine photo-lyase
MTDTAIVWLRRDFRTQDHPALHHAAAHHTHVIPVYIHAPDEEAPWVPGAASRWWLHHSLCTIADALAKLGSPLVVRKGPTLAALRKLIQETGATAVYWNRLYEPVVIARDTQVKDALRKDGLTAESFNGALLMEPWELKTGSGGPYKVFSPFWRNAEDKLRQQLAAGRTPLPAPKKLVAPEKGPPSLTLDALHLLPTIAWDTGFKSQWQPGEKGARHQAKQFFAEAVGHYREKRDLPAVAATSSLSPHLHFGEISPLQLLAQAKDFEREAKAGAVANAEWFVRELGWREFSHHLIFHYPTTPSVPLYERFAAFPWRSKKDAAADLKAWQQGRTGIPIVDAGMRQLWHTGWMHNRVRMIVASLLTKNLLIPWQDGAAWFWDTLVDASLPQNSLGWQWAAGCGADAAPYFRIFNPVLQGEKFDPEGEYVRHWVPELAKVPSKFVHKPWLASGEIQRTAGLAIDSVYRKPVVDLAQSRDRALAAYEQVKG